MISSGTSMGETLYKITSRTKIKNMSEPNSPSISLTPYHPQGRIINSRYIKTNLSSIIDLVIQSKLKNDNKLFFNKNYYINLLKIKLKKNYENKNFPPIKTFTSLKKITNINYNTLNTLTNTNFAKDKYLNTFSYDTLNHHNKNKNNLYKNILDNNPKNLKVVYVKKFLNSKNNKTEENNKMIEDLRIRGKNIGENYNLNLSKLRFRMFHGLDKKVQNNYNSLDKQIKDKFKGLNNKKIRQYFLKNKLNEYNSKIKLVKKNVENTKKRINNLFTYLNKEIQMNLVEEYNKA